MADCSNLEEGLYCQNWVLILWAVRCLPHRWCCTGRA
ncbi:MAG: hypothetical protein ACLS9P_03190 [Haemophilus parainfluenzae]